MRIKNNRRVFVVTPTISTGAYSSGDAIGVLQSVSGAVHESDQSGILRSLVITDIDNQSSALDIVVYEASVTGGTDNAAYTPSAAEIIQTAGLIEVVGADYVTVGSRSVATLQPDLDFQFDASTALYFQVVSRGTPTYTTTSSLQFKYVIQQD